MYPTRTTLNLALVVTRPREGLAIPEFKSKVLSFAIGFCLRARVHQDCVCDCFLAKKMAGDTEATGKYQSLMADRQLLTSLMEAAANGKVKELESVMQKVEERYADSWKEGGDAAKAELLLGFKDGKGRTVAHFAALGGSKKALELVLKSCPGLANTRDSTGKTPLFTSATLGDLAAIELLIDKGAEVNVEAEGGSTSLHDAVYAGKSDAVKALLKHGATVRR